MKNILLVLLFYFSQFIFFFLHAYAKGLLMRAAPASTKASSPWLSLLSSCLAGVGNVLLTNPLWVTNMAIVSGTTETQNLFGELVRLWKERGPRQLWTGTDASLLLVSNPIIQFVCYEQLKRIRLASKARQRQGSNGRTTRPTNKGSVPGTLGPAEAFVCAALAKAIATVSTYPLQLTQTLLRLSSNNKRSSSNDTDDGNSDSEEANVPGKQQQQYRGTMDCLVQLYRKNDAGCAAWFTGMKAKLLQTCLTAAFTFLTYEQILGVVKHVALHTMQMRQNRIRGGRQRKEV
jgi:adenine nucleotide transporter 17